MRFFAADKNKNEVELSGKRRGAGRKRQCDSGGALRLSGYGLKSGFLIRLVKLRLDCGADRAAANDLAERAERVKIRVGMQVASARVFNLARPGDFSVMVKDFRREKMRFTREQHPNHKGAHPGLMAMISPAFQFGRLDFSETAPS